MHHQPANAEEIARLQAMLRARQEKSGYTANVEAIKARIEQLKEGIQ